MSIKFTWKGFLKLLQKVIPVILGATEAKAMQNPPKSGLFTVPTTVVTPVPETTRNTVSAAIVPGAVVAGAAPHDQVIVSSGLKVSWSQVGIVLLQVIVVLRYIGAATGKFVIPLGLEEHIKGIVDQVGILWQSVVALLGLFAMYRLREAMPAKVVIAPKE